MDKQDELLNESLGIIKDLVGAMVNLVNNGINTDTLQNAINATEEANYFITKLNKE